jgi:hypothetical protein
MTKSLTPERLAEIKARTEKATPGPWTTHVLPRSVGGQTVTVHSESGPYTMAWTVDIPPEIGGMVAAPDAVFIAHAREDIPDLLTEVKRLRAGDAPADHLALLRLGLRRVMAERDALQAKLDQVREWAEDNDVTLRRISGEPIHTMAVLLAILDGEENN